MPDEDERLAALIDTRRRVLLSSSSALSIRAAARLAQDDLRERFGGVMAAVTSEWVRPFRIWSTRVRPSDQIAPGNR